MRPIDIRWLRAARLAGTTLLAVGAFDVVLRGHSLSRHEKGAILLVAGAALLALHVVFVRRNDPPAPDALVAAALAVPLLPIGIAILAYSPSAATGFSADIFGGYRDAASVGLIVAAAAYAAAYLVTRHPRWVLVFALALGFGAEFRSAAAPIPIIGVAPETWTPAIILAAAAAVAAVLATAWRTPPGGERLNLLVAAAVLLTAASLSRAGAGGSDAIRDLFLTAIVAAELGIAWWRTTPAVATGVVVSGGMLAASLAQRSGWIGVAAALAGAALAGGATLWARRSAGGGPTAEPPAAAA
jgi:hypothetical protein